MQDATTTRKWSAWQVLNCGNWWDYYDSSYLVCYTLHDYYKLCNYYECEHDAIWAVRISKKRFLIFWNFNIYRFLNYSLQICKTFSLKILRFFQNFENIDIFLICFLIFFIYFYFFLWNSQGRFILNILLLRKHPFVTFALDSIKFHCSFITIHVLY